MMKKSIFLIAALVIQCLAIGWLIFRYERVVTKGTEVRFNCQAYDPYDNDSKFRSGMHLSLPNVCTRCLAQSRRDSEINT